MTSYRIIKDHEGYYIETRLDGHSSWKVIYERKLRRNESYLRPIYFSNQQQAERFIENRKPKIIKEIRQ